MNINYEPLGYEMNSIEIIKTGESMYSQPEIIWNHLFWL